MNYSTLTLSEVISALKRYWALWLVPTVLGGLLTGAYVFFVKAPTWQARQALVVRNEAIGGDRDRLGRFASEDEIRSCQGTLVELVHGRSVLHDALLTVNGSEPSAQEIADLRDAVSLTPPGGAEFGITELFYLNVEAETPQRAVELTSAISEALEDAFQQLRDARAQSIVDELHENLELANADLDVSTDKLTKIETELGPDLPELRAMLATTTGDSNLRNIAATIRNDLRQIALSRETNNQLLQLLREAKQDPEAILAMPNSLLTSQPALSRLKDGLVDAQIQTARLMGTRSASHPLIQAAVQSEREIQRHIHNELETATRSLDTELAILAQREQMLEQRFAEVSARLDRLAEIRATYTRHASETDARIRLVENAQRELAEARASLVGAGAASQIASIDRPDCGLYPIGPSKAALTMLGLIGGLALGLSLVYVVAQPVSELGGSSEVLDALDMADTTDIADSTGTTELSDASEVPAATDMAPAHPAEVLIAAHLALADANAFDSLQSSSVPGAIAHAATAPGV